jgi:FAD/FMN-containing dehydrogenase
LTGVSISDGFRPQGCKFTIDTPAVTLGSGTDMGELNLATSLQNLTVLGAGEESVVYSGYVTGGGHSGLAPSFGLAADVVLEMELVTPGGDILTVNECQNRDFFWAMRGVSPFAAYSRFC